MVIALRERTAFKNHDKEALRRLRRASRRRLAAERRSRSNGALRHGGARAASATAGRAEIHDGSIQGMVP